MGTASDRGKLCDFGTATRIGQSRSLCGAVGTPGFRAPEVETGSEYDATLADVWSFGKVAQLLAPYAASCAAISECALSDTPSARPTMSVCVTACRGGTSSK